MAAVRRLQIVNTDDAAPARAGAYDRRNTDGAEPYDRAAQPADPVPACGRGYAHTYTQAYAQPYGQRYARPYDGPSQGGADVQDRDPAPQDDRVQGAEPDRYGEPGPGPDPRYADSRQPW